MDDLERKRLLLSDLTTTIKELVEKAVTLAREISEEDQRRSEAPGSVFPIRPANGKPEDGNGDSE